MHCLLHKIIVQKCKAFLHDRLPLNRHAMTNNVTSQTKALASDSSTRNDFRATQKTYRVSKGPSPRNLQ